MNLSDNPTVQTKPKAVRLLLLLVAVTAVLSLVYAVQYYAGGPVRLAVTSEIHDLALSPADPLIAAGAQDGRVYLWDTGASAGDSWGGRSLDGHVGPVLSVTFVRDGSMLVSAGRDGTVRLWDVASGQLEETLGAGDGPFTSAAVAADGSALAAVGEDGAVYVWELDTGRMIQSVGPHENTKGAVAVNADGTLVAAGDGAGVQVWDTRTGQGVQRLEGYWDDEAAREEWLGHEKPVTALAFSPDGEILASGSADTTIVFWDLDTGRVRWSTRGHNAAITALVFHPDGDVMLSGGRDSKVRSWRLPGGKSTGIYEGHLSSVNCVAFGPAESDTILAAGDDGTARVWETANQKVIHTEWSRYGLLPMWGKALGGWMLISGLLGLVCLVGLRKLHTWSHLLTLALYLVGPLVVLGLPSLEVISYPLATGLKLWAAGPLIGLILWYGLLLAILTRNSVAVLYEAPQSLALAEQLVVRKRTIRTRFGIFGLAVWILLLVVLYSVLRRFNLDVAFMGHWFSFIMGGAWLTLRISALSVVLAVVLALLGALGRLSGSAVASGISSFYISLIRGTPLLVQIYIWYLGLPRLDIVLTGEVAGVLALGVNYGAYMTEIFRAGIQAIGKGQHEAAQALGMSRIQTFRRIVLPQAFRIVIPPIGNEFIAMMKDSSLVSVMAIWELSFRAQKIGRQNFRSMETFIIAAAFYWVLTVVFQALQGKLEDYMARGERR